MSADCHCVWNPERVAASASSTGVRPRTCTAFILPKRMHAALDAPTASSTVLSAVKLDKHGDGEDGAPPKPYIFSADWTSALSALPWLGCFIPLVAFRECFSSPATPSEL